MSSSSPPVPRPRRPATPAALAALATRLKRLASPGRGDLHTVRFSEGGIEMAAYVPDEEVLTLCRELILDRVYERRGITLADCTGTVVDAGAHVGVFSLRAARWATRVVAIEANPVNFAVLELNLRRNGVANVVPRRAALWHDPAPDLTLTASHHSGGGVVTAGRGAPAGSGAPSGPGAPAGPGAPSGPGAPAGPGAPSGPGGTNSGAGEGRQPLEAVTIDQLVEQLGPIDLLKLDVEGAEFDVLLQARRLDAVRRIAGEVHLDDEQDDRLDAVVAHLRSGGFEVAVVVEAELLSGHESRRRLRANWRSLRGELTTKLLVAGYLLAPVRKPLRRPGATYRLPILLAWRPS